MRQSFYFSQRPDIDLVWNSSQEWLTCSLTEPCATRDVPHPMVTRRMGLDGAESDGGRAKANDGARAKLE
jgi:hypothetical protein